ncbi:MAG TPA: hypothetical protein DCY03_08705 [Planctomycetaceae bacterium]|nr:hypothetical protein [Planctomycetaceae bacterium]
MRSYFCFMFLTIALGCNASTGTPVDSSSDSEAASNVTSQPQSSQASSAPTLSGKWQLVSLIRNGKEALEASGAPIIAEFQNGKHTMKQAEKVLANEEYTLDLTTTPYSINLAIVDGPLAGKKRTGIFEINGTEARLCVSSSEERPQEFKSDMTSNILVLKRM